MRYISNKSYYFRSLALFSIITCALIIDVKTLAEVLQSTGTQKVGEDEYSLYEKRFEALRQTIPAGEILGYVSDDSFGYSDIDFHYGYNLTQYAIAPSIIVSGIEGKIVVGNFSRDGIMSRIDKNDKLILLKDYGDGVMLFRSKVK